MKTVSMPHRGDITRQIWDRHYRLRDAAGTAIDHTLDDTWRRVARVAASAERDCRERWEQRFYELMADFRFLPGGRILANAGNTSPLPRTLFNCFVMGELADNDALLQQRLDECALTLQQGGGIGTDFSPLAPGRVLPALQRWNRMCAQLPDSHPARRGAMMGTLHIDHADILDFIEAKRSATALPFFNLSVLVTDAFMAALQAGDAHAQDLWQKLMLANYDSAEPGVLFIDRINRLNNLWYREQIHCTNPCGEVPLPAYGACNLGSLNLTRFVREAHTAKAHLDETAIREAVPLAIRFLDNVLDLSPCPLPAQRQQVLAARRIGLGITGLADTLQQLGLTYDSEAARQLASRTLALIRHGACETSVELAQEKGGFPLLDREKFLQGEHARRLPEILRTAIARHGLRNSHLTAIAPAGTISLLAGHISTGVEPRREQNVPATAQLQMVAVLQAHVDSAISKTVNVATDLPFAAFASLYTEAYRLGLKGCTTFRPGGVRQGTRCTITSA